MVKYIRNFFFSDNKMCFSNLIIIKEYYYKNTVSAVQQFATHFNLEGYHHWKAFLLYFVWLPPVDLGQNK